MRKRDLTPAITLLGVFVNLLAIVCSTWLVLRQLPPTPVRQEGTFVKPGNVEDVRPGFEVAVTFDHIPTDRVLWLVSQRYGTDSRLQADRRPLVSTPAEYRDHEATACFYGVGRDNAKVTKDNRSEFRYALMLVSLTPTEANALREYNLTKGKGDFPGTQLPEHAVVLDSIDLFRSPGRKLTCHDRRDEP